MANNVFICIPDDVKILWYRKNMNLIVEYTKGTKVEFEIRIEQRG